MFPEGRRILISAHLPQKQLQSEGTLPPPRVLASALLASLIFRETTLAVSSLVLFDAHLSQTPLVLPAGLLVVMVMRELPTSHDLLGPPATRKSDPVDLQDK